MTAPCEKPTGTGPLDWFFASLGEYGRLLAAATELRAVDCECMQTMLESRMPGSDPTSPEQVAKVSNLVRMLASLDLDAETIRIRQPEIGQALETACLGCTKRSRCDQELASGTAARTFAEFCPNAARLRTLSGTSHKTGTNIRYGREMSGPEAPARSGR